MATGTYSESHRSVTIADAVRRWLANREGEVKSGSLDGYRETAAYVIGPLLSGTKAQRTEYTITGKLPEGTRLLPMLGDVKIQELTTGQIHDWHKTLSTEVSVYTANRAKMYLAAALALAAKDMNIRPPTMPTKLGRGQPKAKKLILTTEQVAALLQAARLDRDKGIYVAFPLFNRNASQRTTRPAVGRYRFRSQRDPHLPHAGAQRRNMRSHQDDRRHARNPHGWTLRSMLLEWRLSCPRLRGELHRVFPAVDRCSLGLCRGLEAADRCSTVISADGFGHLP